MRVSVQTASHAATAPSRKHRRRQAADSGPCTGSFTNTSIRTLVSTTVLGPIPNPVPEPFRYRHLPSLCHNRIHDAAFRKDVST